MMKLEQAASLIPVPIWKIETIGCFALVNQHTGRECTPPCRKACALLAYLHARHSQFVSRERLAGLLWCDSSAQQARASLRQALYEIKQAAAPFAPPFTVDRHHVRLDSNCLPPSVRAEEKALRGGDWLPYEDLDDISPAFDEWLSFERARHTRQLLADTSRDIERKLNSGNASGLAAAVRRLQRVDPLDEDLLRLAMLVEHRNGHAASIRRLLRDYAALAERELGVLPACETRRLEKRLIEKLTVADDTGAEAS